MNNTRKTLIALFLLIFIINTLVHSVSSQENKTKEILLQEGGATPSMSNISSESPQKSDADIMEGEQGSIDRSLRILNTVVSAIGVLVTLLSLFLAIGSALGIYGYFQMKKWDEYKKNIDEKIKAIEAIKRGAAAIEEGRNNAEKNVSTLRADIKKSRPASLTEKPSSKLIGKLNEFSNKLELLRVFGGLLTPEDYFYRGYSLYYDEKYETALKDFEAATDEKPDYFDAWYYKGAALANLGYDKKALEAFEKAIEIKPDSSEAWFNKGVVLGSLGQNDDAIKAYETAIVFKPEYAEAWFNKGAVFGSVGQYDDAIKAYEKAIEFKHDYASALYNLASTYSIKKEKEKAIDNLKKAVLVVKSYKDKAKIEKAFENLWNEEDFKKLVE